MIVLTDLGFLYLDKALKRNIPSKEPKLWANITRFFFFTFNNVGKI